MSAWKLAARTLYSIGGSGTRNQVLTTAGAPTSGDSGNDGLYQLVKLGIATSDRQSRGGYGGTTYTLNQLGRDWCEGRAVEVPAPRTYGIAGRRMRFIATWLASLPRGIRINPSSEGQPC